MNGASCGNGLAFGRHQIEKYIDKPERRQSLCFTDRRSHRDVSASGDGAAFRQLEATSRKKNAEAHSATCRAFASYRRNCSGTLLAFLLIIAPHLCRRSPPSAAFAEPCRTLPDAAIPGAQVTLHSIDENTDRTITSDDARKLRPRERSRPANTVSTLTTLDLPIPQLDGITLAARQDLRLRL